MTTVYDKLRGLSLSALDLKNATDWADPIVEDYLSLIDNITIIAEELDGNVLHADDFTADGDFLVGTGAGTYQAENGDTARHSLGLGTVDSPTFAGANFTGDVTGIALNEIEDPTANHSFNMSNKTLTWTFTNPAGGVIYNWTGAASGHLFELKQTVGSPVSETHLLSLSWAHSNVSGIHIEGSATSDNLLHSRVSGDAFERFTMTVDGKMEWDDDTNKISLEKSGNTLLWTPDTNNTIDMQFGVQSTQQIRYFRAFAYSSATIQANRAATNYGGLETIANGIVGGVYLWGADGANYFESALIVDGNAASFRPYDDGAIGVDLGTVALPWKDGNFSGTVSATAFSGPLTGTATQADKLTTARTISLSGDVSGSNTFDGSANMDIVATVANDSHTHDTRYYTETELDAGQLDNRYYTETEVDGLFTTHNASGDHDGRYYTETELDAGQLDSRYYTESEVDTIVGNYLPLTGGTLDNGTNTTLTVLADDAGLALIKAHGDNQGTGAIEVGQSSSYGGGLFYNGDGTPAFATGESSDRISFYRMSAGTRSVVFSYAYSSDNVVFVGSVTAAGLVSTSDITLSENGSIKTPTSPNWDIYVGEPGDTSDYGRLWVQGSDDGISAGLRVYPRSAAATPPTKYGQISYHNANDYMTIGTDDDPDMLILDANNAMATFASNISLIKAGTGAAYIKFQNANGVAGYGYGAHDGAQPYIGFLDADANWAYQHKTDVDHSWMINNTTYLNLTTSALAMTGGITATTYMTASSYFQTAGYVKTDDIRCNTGTQLALNAGESASYATGMTGENVYVNAEAGLIINSSPDNWASGWAARQIAYINKADASSILPGKLTVNDNINAVGYSTSWGSTNGINTGALNTVMGTGGSATWLLSGTSGGTFRAGIQCLDSNGVMRLYSNGSYVQASGGSFTASVFISSVATGTAPLQVSSTTVVANLNASYLSGIPQSSFLRSDTDDNLTAAIIVPTASRDEGMFGTYDSYKTQHIWSMGTAYRNDSAGADFGNLYGAAYYHPNNGAGNYANGHQLAWCQNGVPTAALGTNIWTSGALEVGSTGTFTSYVTAGGGLYTNTTSSRGKISPWNSMTYAIGMGSGYTYGGLGSDYAMTFQMNDSSTRGFWWGDSGHSNAQGAMALTTNGLLSVASGARIGFGESDTTSPTASYLNVSGQITATSNITAYYSDMRLKTKVSGISSALEKINSLSGFYYKENELAKSFGFNNDKVQLGVSAQEVQEVFPEAVSIAPFDMKINEDGNIESESGENYLTVDYEKLVPALIEAIKELSFEVKQLKGKLRVN